MSSSLYETRGPTIFGQENLDSGTETWLGKKFRTRRHLTQPKHDAAVLADELRTVLRGATIGDAKTRLVIPARDPDRRRSYISISTKLHITSGSRQISANRSSMPRSRPPQRPRISNVIALRTMLD